VNDQEICRLADAMPAAFRANRPKTPQELNAQLDAFQAAFHAIQRARDTPTAIAWCGPTIDVLQESARARDLALPGWFAEIVSIVHLHTASEKIKSLTGDLARAIEELSRAKKASEP
jgi:hypothetical protein